MDTLRDRTFRIYVEEEPPRPDDLRNLEDLTAGLQEAEFGYRLAKIWAPCGAYWLGMQVGWRFVNLSQPRLCVQNSDEAYQFYEEMLPPGTWVCEASSFSRRVATRRGFANGLVMRWATETQAIDLDLLTPDDVSGGERRARARGYPARSLLLR